MNRSSPSAAFIYSVSLASLAAAVLSRWLLDPVLGDTLPLVTLFAAIGVAAWIGGYIPALVVVVLGYLVCAQLFIPPRGQLGLGEPRQLAGLLVYLATAGVIVFLCEAFFRARKHYRMGEEAVRQQAELMRTTLASIGDGVITTDPVGKVTSMNTVAEALSGWTSEAAVGLPLTQVFHIVNESTRQVVDNPALRALKEGVIVGLANHTILIAKDGTERMIDDSAAPIRSEGGEVVGSVLVFRDISERYRAEAKQREAQEQITKTLESVTDGFLRYDSDWRIVYANAEAERINRLPRAEMLGRVLWEVFPSLEGTILEKEFRRAAAERVTVEFENFYEPFGRWYLLKGYPAEDGGLTAYIRDITEQKVSLEALKRSEARLRKVFESNVVGMIRWDLDSSLILDANDTFLRMTGYTRDEVVKGQLNFRNLTPPEWTPRNEDGIRNIRVDGQAAPYEKEYFRKDGSRLPLIIAGTRFDDSPSEGMSLLIDISARKRAEQEVARLAAESERQRRLYETVLTNTPDFVYVFSLDHKVLYANDALIKMWGRGYEGAIGKTFLEIGYERWHAEMHDREIDQVRATRKPVRGEVPFHGTHGVRQYDYIFVPIIGADGEVEAVAGTTRDVTERKETERQLQEGQEQLDFALAAADLGYWSLNLTDFTARRSLRHDQLFGYETSLPEWTYEMFLEHVLSGDRAAVDAAFQKSVATGAPWAVECRIRRADGVVRHIWKKGLVRRDAKGKVDRMLSIIGDITERRQLEERQAFLVRLADTLRPLSNPVDVQAEASRALGEWLGANRVAYFEISDGEYVIKHDYAAGVKTLVGQYPVAAFGSALLEAFMEGRTVVEADATTEPHRPPREQAAFAALQVRGHVDVPLVKDGRFLAGMTVHVSERRDWTQQEVALIEDTAERTWAAVERVRVEEALRLSEERFRTLFQSMDEGFFVIEMEFDPAGRPVDYRIEVMNPAFEKHTGISGLAGQSIRQAIPELEEFWYETYGRVASTGDPVQFIHQAGSMGGRWFDVSAFRLGGPGSNKVAILFNDISDRKNSEVEREHLLGQLQEQDKRKDEFLATLAHELRNPLAPIHNGLQIMRMAGVDETLEEARAMMERQLTQLIRLVDDLLDVSRVTSGKLALRNERVELSSIIDAAVETSRSGIVQAGHELAVHVPDEPIFVDGDATRLAQVVSNLLNNSAKYTPRGGHIALTVRREGDSAVVVVVDDGIGIPRNMVSTVFEMFAQVDRTLEKTTGGLGIGLSLVRGLVEMHGGSIEARSEGEGQGSEFIVRLPVASSAAQEVKATVLDQPEGTYSRRRILVADDNVDSAHSLGRLLELLGNDVKTANDGLQALDAAEAFRPEVILLDIGMPGLNGYEVCRRIREQAWGRKVHLVAMTGWGQEEDKRRSQAAGFDLHLVKPVDFDAIKKLLATMKPRTD